MADDVYPCCSDEERQHSGTGDSQVTCRRAIADLDAELPPDLQSALERYLGSGSVTTLRDWATAVRRRTGVGPISIEELCLTHEQTAHWGMVDGDRYYFRCFYDAVILAAIADRPVDIRTESPSGDEIAARAVGSETLSVTPEEAVFSFGIEIGEALSTDGAPTLEQGYALICPYVRAFPNSDAYSQWAGTVPAATVVLPLSGATELAEELVG